MISQKLLAKTLPLALATLTLPACKSRRSSDLHNLSATAAFYDVVIPDGVILVTMPDGIRPADLEDQIRDQLKFFFVGQLKGRSAGSDFNRAEVAVMSESPSDLAANTATYEVHYTARFTVAWPNTSKFPKLFTAVMPAVSLEHSFSAADSGEKSAKSFAETYAESFAQTFDKTCVDESGGTPSLNPWHFRPENTACPLEPWVTGPSEAHGIMTMGTTHISRARLVAVPQVAKDDKSPEYERVWEDGTLDALMIFAKDSSGSSDADDVGAGEFNGAYFNLINILGKPTNGAKFYRDEKGPWPEKDSAELVFKLPNRSRTLRIKMLLVDSIGGASAPTMAAIQDASRTAEFIYYGGHSGYGRNIRGLVDMLDYPQGLYRLYYFDGCNSFDYLNQALTQKVAAANPGFAASKYADVLSNALPAPFGMAPPAVKVLMALVGSNTSYRQILADIDSDTLSIVEGEEDNGAGFPQ